jgi:hypothetical protein
MAGLPPTFDSVPEWGKSRRCLTRRPGGVKSPIARARTAPSRERETSFARGNDPDAALSQASARGAIAKYDHPAGRVTVRKYLDTRAVLRKMHRIAGASGLTNIRYSALIIKDSWPRAVARAPMCAAPWSTAALDHPRASEVSQYLTRVELITIPRTWKNHKEGV